MGYAGLTRTRGAAVAWVESDLDGGLDPIAHAIDDRIIRLAGPRSRVDNALQHRLEVETAGRDPPRLAARLRAYRHNQSGYTDWVAEPGSAQSSVL